MIQQGKIPVERRRGRRGGRGSGRKESRSGRMRFLRPRILHEDKDILVIDKPAGLLAVPIAGSRAPNAQEILARGLGKERGSVLPVHRIDRYTSGLMVFAHTRLARAHLVKQFMAHTPLRSYLALVRGCPHEQEGELRHFLKKVSWGFRQVVVQGEREGGALAVTRFRVLERFQGAALMEAQLLTGLKNQIRVQFAAAGMPIWGDRHYVPQEKEAMGIKHQALHAVRLGFVHPRSETYVEFRADPPEDFVRLLDALRSSSQGQKT